MNVFVFDIETVPDVDGARRLYDFEGLDDAGVASALFNKRLQETGGSSDFLRHHLHRVIAISAVFREGDRLNVWSLGDESADEAEIIRRFFEGLERYSPTLVSWNGSGFDLPVLHYRAMLNGVSAPRYWEAGDEDRSFRYNNYLSRYHWRHVDLMDVLAGFSPRAFVPLDQMASLLGFPGKLGMTGANVWSEYQAGHLREIRDYCETDVLNTWLVYLRFEHMRGHLSDARLEAELERTRAFLAAHDAPHFAEFLAAWDAAGSSQ
ncbi:MAG: 3'-5' exonuclease [Gammaproteobacteria bacterium]